MEAWIISLVAGLGPAIPKVLEKLGEKAVIEPALSKGFKPFHDWFTKRYDAAKANQDLHEALIAALDDLRAELKADPYERLFATMKFTGLDVPAWETLAAAAVVMVSADPDVLPEDLLAELALPKEKSGLLARFLFHLRKHLAGRDGYREGIAYVNDLDKRGLLTGINTNTQRTAAGIEALVAHFGIATNDGKVMKEYLQTLGDQLRYLPLPLADPGTAAAAQSDAELRKIFVPLTLHDLMAEEQARAKKTSASEAGREEEVHPIGLGELLDRHPAFALIGNAGCGKTTLLKMIALAFVENRAGQDLGWHGEPLFPIFLRLRNFGAFLTENSQYSEPGPGALTAYLTHHFGKSYDLDLTPGFFSQRLKNGHCMVLLDGLDEVSQERANVARQVNAFIRHYQPKGNRFGMASRPRGYESVNKYLRPASLAVCDVNPLNADGIHRLIANLLAWIVNDPRQMIEDRQKLAEKILASPALTELASTPLFCTALTLVYKYHGSDLPQRRVDVLEQIVDLLLGFWTAQKPGLAKGHELAILDGTNWSANDLDMAVANKRSRLSYLAYRMQIAEQKTEVDSRTARQWLQAFIEEHEGQPPETAKKWADGFLRYAHEHSGLFREQEGPGVFVFTHEGFREYLAARELIDQGEQNFIRSVLEHLLDDRWEQVVLLAAAFRGYSRRARMDLITKSLRQVERLQEDRDKNWLHTLIMTGTMTRDMDKYLPRPKREAVKNALHVTATNSELKPVTRAAAADILDELGYIHPDLYRFISIVNQQSQIDNRQFQIYIAKFPVTNAQYRRFLKAENFTAEAGFWQNFPKFGEHGQPMDETWGDAGRKWLEKLPDYRQREKDGVVYPENWHDPRFGIARAGVPVVGISWYEANAYCKWLLAHWDELPEGEQNPALKPEIIRLPTEAEWILAAGGDQPEDRFPWDRAEEVTREEAEILRRANVRERDRESGIGRTTPVWTYPLGRSPLGVWDLDGNVWEWQANYHDADHDLLALRGGSWDSFRRVARLAARDCDFPLNSLSDLGFRVVVAAPSP